MNRKAELRELRSIVRYIKSQYPDSIFKIDYFAGLRLPIWLAKLLKELSCGRGWPDLTIFEPRGEYKGAVLELKETNAEIYKKDGSLKTDKHLKEQKAMLDRFAERGWYSTFVVGTERAIEIINEYLNLEPVQKRNRL